jgi:drug/metabolite transporter (DMT)-like permease
MGVEAAATRTGPVPKGGARAISPRVWGALLIIYVIWGSTYMAIREAVQTLPPFLMASARFLVAGAGLYAWAIRRGEVEGDRPGRKQWLAATIAGGLLLAGGNGGVVWAERHIPTGVTALVIATVPLWMVIVGWAWARERVGLREALGVAVGFGGLILLIGAPDGRNIHLAGVLAALVGAMCWATGSVYSKRAPLPRRPLVSTAMQMLGGGALLAILGIAAGELGDIHPDRISLNSILGLAYLIVFGSLVAFTAYVWLLQNVRISLVATYAYVNPVVAVFLGWAFLSERITWVTVMAGAIILVAVALIVSANQKAPPAPAPEPVPSSD